MRHRLHFSYLPLVLLFAFATTACGGQSYKSAQSAVYVRGNSGGNQPSSDSLRTASAPESADADDAPSSPTPAAALPVAPAAPSGPLVGFPATGSAHAGLDVPPPATAHAVDQAKQLLVYTADLRLSVFQVQESLDAIQKVAEAHAGYLAFRNNSGIRIRVPRAQFAPALAAVERVGEVTQRDVRAEDVTEAFADLAARLRNAKAVRDRLLTLLAGAKVQEAIEIEKTLGKMTEEIEVLEGKLKGLGDRIAYSTISVEFAPRTNGIQNRPQLPFSWLYSLGLRSLLQLKGQ